MPFPSLRGPFRLGLALAFVAAGLPLRAQFVTNGSASSLGGDCYRLTPNLPNQGGSVWYTDLIDLDAPFRVDADIFLGTSDGGADGIAFVLQPVSTGVGSSGGGLGYEGLAPSVAVEFDTYQNGVNADPWCDHTGVLSNGVLIHTSASSLSAPVQASATACNVEDGAWHNLSVRWDPALTRLQVYFDCSLRLDVSADIVATVFSGDPEVFFGFSGGTGSLSNDQQVCFKFLEIDLPTDTLAICAGDSVRLSAPPDFTGYAWSPAAGLDDPSSPEPWASPSVSTTYVATFNDDCGNPLTDTVVVLVEATPSVDLGPDTTLCGGAAWTLTAPPGVPVTWPDGSAGPSWTVSTAGTYEILAGGAVCPARDTIVVSVADPVADAGADRSACSGDSVLLEALGVEPGVAYGWHDGTAGPSVWANAPGPWVLTAFEGPCQARDTVLFSWDPLPDPVFVPDSLPWCEGASVLLQPAGSADAWLWSGGQTTASIAVEQPGDYTVTATLGACTGQGRVVVYERDDCDCRPALPNAFSPNGDGINDRFRLLFVQGCPVWDAFEFRVFNRWGEEVFRAPDPLTGWDGSHRGRPAESGSYVYHALLRRPGAEPVLLRGNVTLVR